MSNISKAVLAAVVAGCAAPAFAADLVVPAPVIEPAPVYQAQEFGGWYIRGDLDYHKPEFRGADYITYGTPPGTKSFDSGDLRGAFSLGAGVGYQVTSYLRTDLTVDYWFKSKFNGHTSCPTCSSTDTSKMSALLLLANAYYDLGTWNGFTPYVGAGIGGANVKWDDLRNTISGWDTIHKGSSNWRFAYALMAGASYCLTNNLAFDAGYRFSHINGGRMFEFNGAGPGFDKGFNTHEVRGGLRYSFGGGANACYQLEPVAYEPPEPLYTK
ncbi:opacity protein-like surface antigen [Mesorhizobium soli]|uniref:outer membrane protein n=1 Tax=Pseudaminobacter soli (ex Li et al. 2025) TaxID=1295366 RepID=UPI002477219D|nr:porin family protein [Mesorhizobium soli]MDH6230503.1 opacity protein-like surface antigen [Mesorhizobium soli]